MTSTIPCSSDAFALLIHRRANDAAFGFASFRAGVDACWRFAERNGLVEKWGADLVQHYLAQEFKAVPARHRKGAPR